jgi:hypothetical protein
MRTFLSISFIGSFIFLAACSGGGGFLPRHDGGVGSDGATHPGDMAMLSASCSNGMKDGKETDIDCGGNCTPCADGKGCTLGSDCADKVCLNATCSPPSCNDNFQNGSESDVDCGGTCSACGQGKKCKGSSDCDTNFCDAGTCKLPPCSDGVRDGSESDTDCGGTCSPCGDGFHCNGNSDCQSSMCTNGTCQAMATCFDGIKNGQETDIDCGGPNCNQCSDGLACLNSNDCVDFNCSKQLCCAQGAANCNGSSFDGCEVTLSSDPSNCGTCGKVCPQNTPQCSNGVCVAAMNNFSDSYIGGGTPTPAQCTKWTNYRLGLTGNNYTSVTISGPNGQSAVTCVGNAANQICHALNTGVATTVACNNRTWYVGACGNDTELSTGTGLCMCDNPGYAIRPCLANVNWGGVNTQTCSPPSQTIVVSCN